ncbi:hypothetical protein EV128_116125 [Rhizobium azibense]|nr:hypothetical protein EV128_116125 [Rhizobium azibense]
MLSVNCTVTYNFDSTFPVGVRSYKAFQSVRFLVVGHDKYASYKRTEVQDRPDTVFNLAAMREARRGGSHGMHSLWLKNSPFCNMGRIIPIDPSNNCVNQNKTPLPDQT